MLQVSAALVLIFGVLPVGHNLLVFLEGRYERAEMPEKVDGILVLGGFFNIMVSGAHDLPALNDHGDRVTEALALAQKHPDSLLVFSGGTEGAYKEKSVREADDTKLFIQGLDLIPENQVFFEQGSRNSYENLTYSKELLAPKQGENWVLVTSAFHMRRSMAIAKKLQWEVSPYPVDYKVIDDYHFYPRRLNLLDNFYKSHLALKEILGYVAYALTGKL